MHTPTPGMGVTSITRCRAPAAGPVSPVSTAQGPLSSVESYKMAANHVRFQLSSSSTAVLSRIEMGQ